MVNTVNTEVTVGLMAVAGLVVWCFSFMYPKFRLWKLRRDKLNTINRSYESLRCTREDMAYHFYWAKDRGDHGEADGIENRIVNLDQRLETMRAKYLLLENYEVRIYRSLVN